MEFVIVMCDVVCDASCDVVCASILIKGGGIGDGISDVLCDAYNDVVCEATSLKYNKKRPHFCSLKVLEIMM